MYLTDCISSTSISHVLNPARCAPGTQDHVVFCIQWHLTLLMCLHPLPHARLCHHQVTTSNPQFEHTEPSNPRHLRNLYLYATSSSISCHCKPITNPSCHTTMPSTQSNVPTTCSGLQQGDPPLPKRKKSNADEQMCKCPKSEKDDEEGVEKKGKEGRVGKKEQKNKKRGKGAWYVLTITIPLSNPTNAQENQC